MSVLLAETVYCSRLYGILNQNSLRTKYQKFCNIYRGGGKSFPIFHVTLSASQYLFWQKSLLLKVLKVIITILSIYKELPVQTFCPLLLLTCFSKLSKKKKFWYNFLSYILDKGFLKSGWQTQEMKF